MDIILFPIWKSYKKNKKILNMYNFKMGKFIMEAGIVVIKNLDMVGFILKMGVFMKDIGTTIKEMERAGI